MLHRIQLLQLFKVPIYSQNVSINTQNSFITIIQGVDVGQNNRNDDYRRYRCKSKHRIDYSNAAITIIQGIDVSQNARMTIIEGVDISQNSRMSIT
jgi:translation initiation factor 1 (eIF-1/SUI1)